MQESFSYILSEHAKKYDLTYIYEDLKNRFAELIHTLYKQYSLGVVVLVDEYDNSGFPHQAAAGRAVQHSGD